MMISQVEKDYLQYPLSIAFELLYSRINFGSDFEQLLFLVLLRQ
jgi:hypothetical protein